MAEKRWHFPLPVMTPQTWLLGGEGKACPQNAGGTKISLSLVRLFCCLFIKMCLFSRRYFILFFLPLWERLGLIAWAGLASRDPPQRRAVNPKPGVSSSMGPTSPQCPLVGTWLSRPLLSSKAEVLASHTHPHGLLRA